MHPHRTRIKAGEDMRHGLVTVREILDQCGGLEPGHHGHHGSQHPSGIAGWGVMGWRGFRNEAAQAWP